MFNVNRPTPMTYETLPILTFDERKLTPAYGYVFNPKWLDPHESIVSILWKFAHMNALPGHVLAAQAAKESLDPYEGVEATRAAVDIRRLRDALGLPLKLLRSALVPDSLSSVASRYFRHCPRCMTRGYHAAVHQLEILQLCPIHGHWLRVECRYCGYSAPYRLHARLLDAPFRCANCRFSYASSGPYFLRRRALSKTAQVTMTRLRLRYHWS